MPAATPRPAGWPSAEPTLDTASTTSSHDRRARRRTAALRRRVDDGVRDQLTGHQLDVVDDHRGHAVVARGGRRQRAGPTAISGPARPATSSTSAAASSPVMSSPPSPQRRQAKRTAVRWRPVGAHGTWYTERCRAMVCSTGWIASSSATASLALPVAVSKRFGEHDGSRLAATSRTTLLQRVPADARVRHRAGHRAGGQRRPARGPRRRRGRPDPGDRLATRRRDTVARQRLGARDRAGDGASGPGWRPSARCSTASTSVADVPVHQRPNFVMKRLRALAFLVLFGLGISPVDARLQRRHAVRRRLGRGRRRPRRHVRRQRPAAADDVLRAPGTTAAVAPAAAGRRRRRRRCSSCCSSWRASSCVASSPAPATSTARSPRSSPCSAGSTSSAA